MQKAHNLIMLNQKDKFSLEDHVTYLNMAYMAPLLKSVEAAGQAGISRKARPYTVAPEDFFNQVIELKKTYAKLIEADDYRRIAVIPSVSYGMANVAKNLHPQPGDEIVVVDEQFPSNMYPWLELSKESGVKIRVVEPPKVDLDRGQMWNQAIIDAISAKTIMVAMAHVHWADGTRFDLHTIRDATKAYGSLLVLDGTQSVGALPFSVKEIQPDALVCGGYKWLLGPYSIGLAYYGEYFDTGSPVEHNWINRLHAEDFKNLVNYQPKYGPMATKYNVGENSNFVLVPMMMKALEQILDWSVPAIQDYCAEIAKDAIQAFKEKDCQVESTTNRGHHLFGVRFPKRVDIGELQAHLRAENIFVSFRGNSMRIAPYLYNEEADFEKLLGACGKLLDR